MTNCKALENYGKEFKNKNGFINRGLLIKANKSLELNLTRDEIVTINSKLNPENVIKPLVERVSDAAKILIKNYSDMEYVKFEHLNKIGHCAHSQLINKGVIRKIPNKGWLFRKIAANCLII